MFISYYKFIIKNSNKGNFLLLFFYLEKRTYVLEISYNTWYAIYTNI